MTTYLGALSHGAHTIVINRDGRNIRYCRECGETEPLT